MGDAGGLVECGYPRGGCVCGREQRLHGQRKRGQVGSRGCRGCMWYAGRGKGVLATGRLTCSHVSRGVHGSRWWCLW